MSQARPGFDVRVPTHEENFLDMRRVCMKDNFISSSSQRRGASKTHVGNGIPRRYHLRSIT